MEHGLSNTTFYCLFAIWRNGYPAGRQLTTCFSYCFIFCIHHTHHQTLPSFIGDCANDLSVMLWVVASLEDDLRDSKSTSGAYLVIDGPNSFAPIIRFFRKSIQLFRTRALRARSLPWKRPFAPKDFLF